MSETASPAEPLRDHPTGGVATSFPAPARRLGLVSAWGAVLLGVAYVVFLGIGLASLPSPDAPIGNPWFTALEVLILSLMPFQVTLMIAVHAWSPPEKRPYAFAAVVFIALTAVLTSAVHFAILTLSRRELFEGFAWLFSFTWPSVVYALDILAWDVFFPIAVLFAAPVFANEGLERWIRLALVLSGVLSLAGLVGVAADDMQIRNIGIVGYAVVFPIAAALTGVLWARSKS